MNDLARERLGELVTSYGTGLTATPRMCAILLKQKCAEFPAEVEVLSQAVQHGTVNHLMKVRRDQEWDPVCCSLVSELVETGVQEEEARWAVESWAVALGKHPKAAPRPPEPKPDWNRLPEEQANTAPEQKRGALYHPLIGGLCGAIGGAVGAALELALAIAFLDSLVDAVGPQFAPGGDVLIWVLIVVAVVFAMLGAVFGALGGAFGLYVSRMFVGETRGGLFWAKCGALGGAAVGAFAGVFFFGIAGVIGGSLLGGWLGAFSSVRGALTKRW
jgi:hypothetical protein